MSPLEIIHRYFEPGHGQVKVVDIVRTLKLSESVDWTREPVLLALLAAGYTIKPNAQKIAYVRGLHPRTNQKRTTLDTFIAEKCRHVPGALISFAEFFDAYETWGGELNKVDVSKSISAPFVYGRHHHNIRYLGNIAWADAIVPATRSFRAVGQRLKR